MGLIFGVTVGLLVCAFVCWCIVAGGSVKAAPEQARDDEAQAAAVSGKE